MGILALSFFAHLSFAATTQTNEFHEIARYSLSGEGGWDYVLSDDPARRLYIARANRIMVVDSDKGTAIGEVSGLDGAHGVALVKDLNRGFASSGKSGEVVVFDLKDFKVVGKIKAGENPDCIIYDPSSKHIFAFNGRSQDVSVIDPATMKLTASIALSGKPEFAVSDGLGKVFVNIEDKSELAVIDSGKQKVISTYKLAPCAEPTGLAMDGDSRKLIVGCGNKMAVIVNANSGVILQKFKAGEGIDATAFDREHHLAFVSAGEGVLTILSENKSGFQLAQSFNTVKGARTLAVDEKTGHVFLPFAKLEALREKKGRPSVVPGTFALLAVGN